MMGDLENKSTSQKESNLTDLDDDTRETTKIDSKRIKLDKSIHSDLNLNEGNNAEFPREVLQISVVKEIQTTEVENERTNCEISVRKSAGIDVTTADVASNAPIADDENQNSFSKENSSQVSSACEKSTKIIYYDLETTHFDNYNKHKGVEILQIGAITNIDGETFRKYILPTKPIPPDATNIHGIFMKKKDDSNELDWNSLYIKEDGVVTRVDAVDKRTGFDRFITWMETFRGKVTLAGYNSHWYDDWVLCHEMQGVVQKDRLPICSFADVSKIVRPVLEAKGIKKKCKLGLAVSYLLKRGQGRAHEAVSDAKDCRDLVIKIGEMKKKTPQELLIGNRNSVKDFDDVWQVCMSMANLI